MRFRRQRAIGRLDSLFRDPDGGTPEFTRLDTLHNRMLVTNSLNFDSGSTVEQDRADPCQAVGCCIRTVRPAGLRTEDGRADRVHRRRDGDDLLPALRIESASAD